jgi:hypothetical protein
MSATITIESLSGKAIEDYIPDLARLRIEVFRDFPYLYEGNLEYEEKYLRTYVESPESIVVLARDGERVVGASTGLPMEHETEEFQKPFREQGYDPGRIFYCAESVLLTEYRGRGIYKKFFEGRESHALRLSRFDYCAFCCVQRPADHPLRPSDYVPLDAVWARFGYVKHPELIAYYAWKDVGESEETLKPMVFWIKSLREGNRG